MKTSKSIQRRDVEHNRGVVRDAYHKLLTQNKGRRPTIQELSKECRLHPSTIKDHIKSLDFADLSQTSFRVLSDDVILSIYRSAMAGKPAAQKLWMQIVEGWNEKTETKHSGEIALDHTPSVILKFTK
jgi:hypothetical protein